MQQSTWILVAACCWFRATSCDQHYFWTIQCLVNELKKVDSVTVATQHRNRYLERPTPSSLADVVDVILDKGLVIDIYVRVSLLGIELLTIDARIVIASVDTYLRFAEAVNRLDLSESENQLMDMAG